MPDNVGPFATSQLDSVWCYSVGSEAELLNPRHLKASQISYKERLKIKKKKYEDLSCRSTTHSMTTFLLRNIISFSFLMQ